jgi:hypothetical protein
MRTFALLLAVLCVCSALAAAQEFPFDKYPVTSTFKGIPATPKLTTDAEQRFRTVITEGAKKGPNFAGHYTVITWGCGAACASFAIVDATTGAVFEPPFTTVSFESDKGQFFQQSGLHYQPDSSLFVIQGCPDGKDCAEHLYRWTGEKLEQVGSEPLKPLPRTAPKH